MIFFTSLIQYKQNGPEAPPVVSMHHYPNLMETHGIVLMAAKIDNEKISTQDAQFLAYCVELFYGTDDGEMVRTFRYKPQEFRHEMVIEKIEQLVSNSKPRQPNPNQSKGTLKPK